MSIPAPIIWTPGINYSRRSVIFLDRDGVINIEKGYLHTISEFVFVDGVLDAIQRWRSGGYGIIVVTNQSGIGRGYYSTAAFMTLTQWMMGQMDEAGAAVDAVYYCPHGPDDNCLCRKPRPGMIISAINDYSIDPNRSYIIGDSDRDIEAGKRAGLCGSVLFTNDIKMDSIHFPTQQQPAS